MLTPTEIEFILAEWMLILVSKQPAGNLMQESCDHRKTEREEKVNNIIIIYSWIIYRANLESMGTTQLYNYTLKYNQRL